MSKTLPADCIVLPVPEKSAWIVYNVFARTGMALNTAGLALLLDADSDHGEILVWKIHSFTNYEGLFADPGRLQKDPHLWPDPDKCTRESFFEICCELALLIEDQEDYRRRFQSKESLLDKTRFGNFHQQLGQELLISRRESPDEWWLNQKFSEDRKAVLPNHYGAIQESFTKEYFANRFSSESVVVDIGCGIGHYTNMIANLGCKTIGVDPNKEFLQIAQQNSKGGAQYLCSEIGSSDSIVGVEEQSADYVLMMDALLFYFFSPSPDNAPDIQKLLKSISRILKPGGRFISIEPHYTFWLLPWLGEIDRPFTVLTEYLERQFHVTPCMSQLIQAFAKGGFAVSWMEELVPDESFRDSNERAYHFAMNFPIWQVFECVSIDNTERSQ